MKANIIVYTIIIMVSAHFLNNFSQKNSKNNLAISIKKNTQTNNNQINTPSKTFTNNNEVITSSMYIEKDHIQINPDFAYGESYRKEYLANLNNLVDWDSEPQGYKVIKGFTRNYFSADNGGKIKLLKKLYGSNIYDEEDCLWYIDDVCININEPKAELLFNKDSGAYKVEAKRNDTILLSFTAVFIDYPEVIFQPPSSYDGEYGFDDNRFEEVARLNNAQYLNKKNKYLIPFMSMVKGQTATLEAQVMYNRKNASDGDRYDMTDIEFVTSSNNISIKDQNKTAPFGQNIKCRLSDFANGKVILDVKAEGITQDAYIEARIGNKVIGKVSIYVNICLPPSNLILVKVIVNEKLGLDIDLDTEKKKIETLLNNKSYNQTFTQWRIIRTQTLNLTIDKKDIKLFDIFRAAVDDYNKNKLKPEKAAIMFISDSSINWDANGYGHFTNIDTQKYTIVNSKALDGKTPVHELGHNHELPEMASKFKSYFYDTNNFMDYYSTYNNDTRKTFWKYQWVQIYNSVKNG